MTMARPASTNTPGTLLLSKTETGELEESGGSPGKQAPERPLGAMYLEENRTGTGAGAVTVNYLDGGYDYVGASAVPTSLYNGAGVSYYPAPAEAHGPASDASLHSLSSLPNSPLVFLPSSPTALPLRPHLPPPCRPAGAVLPGERLRPCLQAEHWKQNTDHAGTVQQCF
ncbi:hypothetical protein SKAU_G00185280 [Synaphobranchus kaupii]|uniref:Estrogen receptor N-terminal domain-containing protein n=1 Tax=Synaphobranchus kaupii TaxID=118154 RepID=A0A9Q1IVT5_SYNKA|nr:hypothetical protein SKAU_G00185280 [Synaphobranchus kaupii]